MDCIADYKEIRADPTHTKFLDHTEKRLKDLNKQYIYYGKLKEIIRIRGV